MSDGPERPDNVDGITDEWMNCLLRRPPDFMWFGDERVFDTWSLGPLITHRDACLDDQAKARAVEEYLSSREELADQWELSEASHWLVGHATHLSFLVRGEDGGPSDVLCALVEWWADVAEQEEWGDRHPLVDKHREDLIFEYLCRDVYHTMRHELGMEEEEQLLGEQVADVVHWILNEGLEDWVPDSGGSSPEASVDVVSRAVDALKGKAESEE